MKQKRVYTVCPKCHKKGVYETTDRAGRGIENCRYCLYSKSINGNPSPWRKINQEA